MLGQDICTLLSKEWPSKIFQEGGGEICFRKMKFGAVCRMNGGLGKAGEIGYHLLQPLTLVIFN